VQVLRCDLDFRYAVKLILADWHDQEYTRILVMTAENKAFN